MARKTKAKKPPFKTEITEVSNGFIVEYWLGESWADHSSVKRYIASSFSEAVDIIGELWGAH